MKGVVVCKPTAGWRSAPTYTLRVRTRGLARISPISVEERDEHSSLEWFGSPERNTLRPLCVVLIVLLRG